MSSVCPSVCPSVCLSPISQPLLHLESWNFEHKSVGLQWSIVRSGILDPWPRSPGIWPWVGPLPRKTSLFKHNFSFCGSNWTCEGSLERSQCKDHFELKRHGHVRLWPTPQSGQSPKFPLYGMMVLKRSGISWRLWNNPIIPILGHCAPWVHGHNPAKVPKFQHRAWWYSIDQEFHDDYEKRTEYLFWATTLHWPMAMIWPKFKISNIGHDGTLSIRNFVHLV